MRIWLENMSCSISETIESWVDGFGIIIRHDFQHADFLQFPIWLKYDIKHSTKNSTKTASLTEFYGRENDNETVFITAVMV